ncbi:immunoglobulin superfamily DCC subclass member 3-like isoform X2 [Nerophis ophidion]|uniref:immunoglobulin superfamily DCC subclass member 3-like isoform X2 n=1 Tax=Nerophis ophidion TaxID=159077 RepID=UPI002ADFD6B8|nr:immunoglobulin superfamily DCC subclass member 3-like isoform X2 [Nerophis ophidion]
MTIIRVVLTLTSLGKDKSLLLIILFLRLLILLLLLLLLLILRALLLVALQRLNNNNNNNTRWKENQATNEGVGGASELLFLKEPSDVIAVEDRPLMLDCQVEGEGPVSITWRKDGVAVETRALANGALLIHSFSGKRRSNGTDAGEYECAARNRYGMLISRKARVQLATLPRFVSHPQSMAVDEGGVARLTCRVNGIPEADITWQKDRRPLSTQDHRYTLLPHGVLHINGVRQSDSGRFRCAASNVARTRRSHEARLSVTRAASKTYKEPVILSGPQNLTINVHQTAVLECIATGNPLPIMSWSRLDGRSIGVEGVQVLGSGNLVISDAMLRHSGVYVCSANRPGSRSRRTALGRLMVQAPPEFVHWPQSVSRPAGGSAVFSCSATGVPEPHIIWLKNGKVLRPSANVKLANGNTTLAVTHIAANDEAIYQCVAENSAGANQASARLAVSQGPHLPEAPSGLRAAPLSSSGLQIMWDKPPDDVSQHIIGYVLHIRRLGEADSAELQEAVSRTTFSHEFSNLEAATTYSIYLKAYSALGGSRQSSAIISTTLGGVPSPPSFFTKVLNRTAMQVYWDLPSKPGKVEGFKLKYYSLSKPLLQAQETFPGHINTHALYNLEPHSLYEIQLAAFNGNGESLISRHLVSLEEDENITAGASCKCDWTQASRWSVLLCVHGSVACVLCFLFFILLAYRRRKAPPTVTDVSTAAEEAEMSQWPDSAPSEMIPHQSHLSCP